MKALLFILLSIFTLSESYLIYGFYRFNLAFDESLLFTASGLTLLVTTLFLGYYKKGLRIASKLLFTILCLIGMWFNLLSIKNKTEYSPIPLKALPIKESWTEYRSRGHSWISYKEYIETEYKQSLRLIQSENKQIKLQNKIAYEKFKRQSTIAYNEYVFFIGRGLFSVLLIFAIDLIVILILERLNQKKVDENKSQMQSQSKQKIDSDIIEKIKELSKEKYKNGNRKLTNHRIASIVGCDVEFVGKIIPKRKYEKAKKEDVKIYRVK